MKESVQSVERVLLILEVLSDYEDGLRITEISSQIHLHKSTVYRLLSTLIQKGYVTQNSDTSKYKLTLKLFELGSKQVEKIDVLSIAKPYLKSLAEEVNEVVHLVVRDGADIIYIDKVECENTIRMYSSIGKRSPMYCTSVGKAIMAYLTKEEVQKIWKESNIKKLTNQTITEYHHMLEELENIRRKGYAVDHEENEAGVRCVGAPIFDYSGNVYAAISISGPSIRVTEDKTEEFAELVMEYSRKISKELGYKG